MTLTAAAAQAMHDYSAARGGWLVWTLTDIDLEYPGRYVGRAHEADHNGGKVLPTELTRRDRTSALPPDVIETWD